VPAIDASTRAREREGDADQEAKNALDSIIRLQFKFHESTACINRDDLRGQRSFFKAVLGASFICAAFALKHCERRRGANKSNAMPPAEGTGENFFRPLVVRGVRAAFLMKPAIDEYGENKFAFLRLWRVLDVARCRRRCAAISVAR
jgi:hypothetical protein